MSHHTTRQLAVNGVSWYHLCSCGSYADDISEGRSQEGNEEILRLSAFTSGELPAAVGKLKKNNKMFQKVQAFLTAIYHKGNQR